MEKLIKFLKGKKTYLVVIVGILLNGANAMGYIQAGWIEPINIGLGFLGLGTLRLAVKK